MDDTVAPAAPPGQSPERRYGIGPRPLARLLPPIVKHSLGRTGGVLARLALDWSEIIGPRLARETAPRRLAQSCLTIACAGPVALELQHLSSALLERINRHYGRPVATRLRFLQGPIAAAGLERDASPRHSLPPPRPIAGLDAGPLHDALASLRRHIDAEHSGRDADTNPQPKLRLRDSGA